MDEPSESENLDSQTKATADLAPAFISYASHDAAIAQKVCSTLEGAGFPCWMAPRDVKPGAPYADAIVGAINEARALVLVLSGNAVASDHVAREVERAASKHKTVITFRIDSTPLNPGLEYFLSNSQWIDVMALGMSSAMAKLKEAVEQETKPTGMAADVDFRGRRKRRRLAVLAALGLGVGIAVTSGVYFLAYKAPRPASTVAVADKSIAVLPFADLSEKKDEEYFADGMAEEILDLLAKIPAIKVIGRTSSFQFKGKNEDLRRIGTELGAAYVLEGSVRKAGDRVRITAQLIDTHDGTRKWSETYDRNLDDVLKMQDEIAAALVRALQITIGPESLQSRPTLEKSEAYKLYLRGRYAFDHFDKDGLNEAASYFRRALELDPTFADAAAWLAAADYLQGEQGLVPPGIAFEKARQASDAALKLNPKLSLAHTILGAVYASLDWEWAAADRETHRALALAPNDEFALWFAARLSMVIGRYDEALTQMDAGLAQNPVGPYFYQALDWIQTRRGNLREAEAAARRALEINPTYSSGHYYLGLVLLARGQREAALAEIQQETPEGGQLGGLAIAYSALGRKAESDDALARMIKEAADLNAFGVAEAYAFRGELDDALHWLDRAYAQKDAGLIYIKGDWPLKNLEGDPRFKAFLKKMNLPD